MIDSGSDCSLIQLSAARQLIHKKLLNSKSKYRIDLKTYSDSKIKVFNIIKVPLYLDCNRDPVTIDFLVTSDAPGVPRILLGLDFIRSTGSKISYLPDQNPLVQITQPFSANLETGYVNDLELRTCTAKIQLLPHEEKVVFFELGKVNNILPYDSLIVDDATNRLHLPYYVFLSASKVQVDYIGSKSYVVAMVCNITNKPITTEAVAIFEILYGKVKSFNNKKIDSFANMTFMFDTFPKQKCLSYNINVSSIPLDNEEVVEFSRSNYHVSINNTYIQETPEREVTEETINSFNDPSKTILLDVNFDSDIPHEDIYDPGGLEISTDTKREPQDIVKLEDFDPQVAPYIKKIFLDKYPALLATDTLDKGNLSQTLGKYTIQLNSSENLPKQRKIYYLGKMESQHLRDILEFHLRAQIIKKVDHRGDKTHHFASPAYLVPRSKPGAPSRLIIDFRSLNAFIKYESVALPEISSILNNLRNCQYFSSADLSNAYNSIELEEDCTYLTTFSTQHGSFQMKTLPQGLSVSPEIFNRYISKALNERIIYDKHGKPKRDHNNIIITEYDPIEGVHIYYDDLIIGSYLENTISASIAAHFDKVELVMQRLHSHNAKINFAKSEFCKPQIKFLGWLIRNNFIICDNQRLEKMRNAEFPETKKGMRSFCGLVNSVRAALGARTLEKIHLLTPLTSSIIPYNPTEKHRDAFNILKVKLTEKPIFSKIIQPKAEKFLFCDASSARDGYYSAVLLQMIDPSKEEKFFA